MKSKSKYSLCSIAIAAVAVLVMFFPCLNGVSIMKYVWYPNEYETEYFKAPFTKGLIKVNGSLQNVQDATVEGAEDYAKEYDEYMKELVEQEKKVDDAEVKYAKDKKTLEDIRKETDVIAARYNAPVEEADRVYTALKNKLESFDGDLRAKLDSLGDSYVSIEATKELKAELSGIAKILASKYENYDVMIEAAEEIGSQYKEMNRKIMAMRGEVVNLTASDDAELRSIVEDRKTIVDKEAELKNLQGIREIKDVDLENASAVIETLKARLDGTVDTEEDETVAKIRAEYIGDSAASDKEMIANDIKTVEALIEAKKAEIVALDADIANVEKEIAVINGSIAKYEADMAALDSSNDFLVYKLAVLLDSISRDNAAAEKNITEAKNFIKAAADFDPVKTKLLFDEKLASVAGLSEKVSDIAAAVNEKAEAAKKDKYVAEGELDFTALDATVTDLRKVAEILNRQYFDAYFNNNKLIGDDKAEGTFAASADEIAKIIYLAPEARLDVYKVFLDKVTASRDAEVGPHILELVSSPKYGEDFAAIISAKLQERGMTGKNKGEYDLAYKEFEEESKAAYEAAEEEFKSFVDAFEAKRTSSTLYENSMAYLELVKNLFESKATVKENNAAIKEVTAQNKGLAADIAKLKKLSVITEDVDGDALDEINNAVKENVQLYVTESATAKSVGANLSFYENKISSGNALSEIIELNANYKHNEASIEDYTTENEEELKSQAEIEAQIEEMKKSGLVEVQLTGDEYKEMINDDDIFIEWYNYFINNEVRFFLYIMILFIVVVLLALFVKFWQLNVIANFLFGAVMLITFFCSDLLFVGSFAIRFIYLILGLGALAVTVLLVKEAKEKKAEE